MTIKLTELELTYLKPVLDALGATPEEDKETWFGFEAYPEQNYLNWSFAYHDEALKNGITKAQMSGVVSSLAQKGILYVETTGAIDDRATSVSNEGMEILRQLKQAKS